MRDKLLGNTAKSGVYFLLPRHQKPFKKAIEKLQFQVLHADLSGCRNTPEALLQLGGSLRFPDWYGANFDALFDCLSDPSWQPAPGIALMINGAESLRLADPEGFATLIEVFAAAADAHREAGQPFWLLLDSAIPGVTALPEA